MNIVLVVIYIYSIQPLRSIFVFMSCNFIACWVYAVTLAEPIVEA